jgi:hypothetical protein
LDRRRALAALLIGIAGLIGMAGLGANPSAPPLREVNWIAPDRRAAVLRSQPPECVILPESRADRELVALGRLLFRTPLLLGGQAARSGLSCASCHRNGRGNPDFLFPGLSGAAGTADITSSLMSRTRGDGQTNPVPIPDLARDAPKVSRNPSDPALKNFIRGLVVDEFDGVTPAPRTLSALAAYVRALKPEGCKDDAAVPISLAGAVGDIVLGLSVVRTESTRGDVALTRLALGSLRDRLGTIAARYPNMVRHQTALARLDRDLLALQQNWDAAKLVRWEKRFVDEVDALAGDEQRSQFAEMAGF